MLADMRLGRFAVFIFSLLPLAFSGKYCSKELSSCNGRKWCRNRNYCCSKDYAWGSASSACANDDNYKKIYAGCVSQRRRSSKVCCSKKNDRQTCPTPSPPSPPPSSPTPPSPTPPSSPAPSSTYSASTSRYFPGDTGGTTSDQVGACGGAVLGTLATTLSALVAEDGMHYFPIAISQSMAQPLMCSTANDEKGTGSPSIQGAGYPNVLHSYCGQCIQFTTEDGRTVGGVVLDTCPYSSNNEYCSKDGAVNDHGFYNHLDIYGSNSSAVTNVIGDNPTGAVQAITCPPAVTNALTTLAAASQENPKSEVCTWYWDGRHWQGSPGMSDFGCSECSGSGTRRLRFGSARTSSSEFADVEEEDEDDDEDELEEEDEEDAGEEEESDEEFEDHKDDGKLNSPDNERRVGAAAGDILV